MSFGYGGTAKKCTDKMFEDYGLPFGIGQEVVCLVDVEEEQPKIGYALNG